MAALALDIRGGGGETNVRQTSGLKGHTYVPTASSAGWEVEEKVERRVFVVSA